MRIYRAIVAAILLVASGGCGESGPGPRPTPEGQTGPGEPDASGIPKPPTTKAGG